jgi:hypothetical protein
MLAFQAPYNLSVEALAVINDKGVYRWTLHVSGEKEITLIGQVEIAEDENAFLVPPQTGVSSV